MKNKKFEKKYVIASILLGMLVAGLQVLGFSYSKQGNWALITQWKMIGGWIGVSFLFSILIMCLFQLMRHMEGTSCEGNRFNIKMFLGIGIIILVCWAPYIIINYPCSFNPDVRDQLGQVFHNSDLCWTKNYVKLSNPEVSFWNNHHPVTHTFIIGCFAKLGIVLGGMRQGLFLMAFTQAVLMAGVFSYIICFLKSKGVSNTVCIIISAFYALWPLNALSVNSLCKDTLFTFFILIATIILIRLFENPKEFLTIPMMFFTCFIFIMQGLIRNNGLYLLIVMLPISFILGKGARKRIAISFVIPILFLGVFMPKVVFPLANIAPGGEKEMYSVPLQQIARTLKEHEDGFLESDIQVIENVMCPGESYKDIQRRYTGNNADPVKYSFNLNLTDRQRAKFFKIWFKYLLKYPTTYVQATMNNNYEYFYYERNGNVLYYNGIQVQGRPIMGLSNAKRFESQRNQLWKIITKVQHNKYVGWMVNIGFYMCVLLVILGYALVTKRFRLFWAFGFIIFNIMINMLGPLVYMRYAYYFIVCIPLLFGLLTVRDEEKLVGLSNTNPYK